MKVLLVLVPAERVSGDRVRFLFCGETRKLSHADPHPPGLVAEHVTAG